VCMCVCARVCVCVDTHAHTRLSCSVYMLSVKCTLDGEMRRFAAPQSSSYEELVFRIQEVFMLAPSSALLVQYTDTDEDLITVTSTRELEEAVRCVCATGCLKLQLVSDKKKGNGTSVDEGAAKRQKVASTEQPQEEAYYESEHDTKDDTTDPKASAKCNDTQPQPASTSQSTSPALITVSAFPAPSSSAPSSSAPSSSAPAPSSSAPMPAPRPSLEKHSSYTTITDCDVCCPVGDVYTKAVVGEKQYMEAGPGSSYSSASSVPKPKLSAGPTYASSGSAASNSYTSFTPSATYTSAKAGTYAYAKAGTPYAK
jgi:hypothetical protein